MGIGWNIGELYCLFFVLLIGDSEGNLFIFECYISFWCLYSVLLCVGRILVWLGVVVEFGFLKCLFCWFLEGVLLKKNVVILVMWCSNVCVIGL